MKGIIVSESLSGNIGAYRRLCGDAVSLFSTREADFETTIGWGADAVISYLSMLIPESCVRLESGIRFNQCRHSAEDSSMLNRLERLFLECDDRPAVAREVLKCTRGMDCGSVRPPRAEMTEGDRTIAGECIRLIRSAGL